MLKLLPRALAALALLLAPAAHAQEVKDADPALWVVKDKDTTIYLFGTFHFLRPGLSWFDEAVRQAFDDSGEVVLEMIEPDAATAQSLMTQAAASNDGMKITERLTEEQRAVYLAALAKMQLPAAMLDDKDPWYAALTVSIVAMLSDGLDPNSGAEKVITAAAEQAGKKMTGLETMERQLGFFDKLSADAQVTMLMSTLQELPGFKAMMDKMLDDWTKGNADGIAEMLNQSIADSPETMQLLLTDRNAKWADWIAQRMKQPGTVFIAVGAGHLAGNDSVQAFLQKKHIKAKRVEY